MSAGVGVGAGIGAVATFSFFVVLVITVKVFMKFKQRTVSSPPEVCPGEEESSSSSAQHVAMERNLAYELHKPLPQRKCQTEPQPPPCSAPQNVIYEDLK